MRVCTAGTIYTCTITDNQSVDAAGKPTVLTLYYRLPTTEERQQYANELISRLGDTVVKNDAATRVKFGAKILTGIGDGCFGRMNGVEPVNMSSDAKSKDYCENWRDELMQGASDVLYELAVSVFERSIQRAQLSVVDAEKN